MASTVTQEFRDAVTSTIVKKDPELTLNSIVGFEDIKRSLKSVLYFKTVECQLINNVLLFGPDENEHYPLAEALANKWKATLFRVSGSSLGDMNWWTSSTYMRKLLHVASERSPSIIFIDEVDKLSRQSGKVLMDWRDEMNNEDSETIVIGSTSRPTQFDILFQNWFQMKLFVPLPDFEVRRTLIKSEIGSAWQCLSNEELNLMANMTKGYKRLDISKIVQQLLQNQQSLLKSANYFVKVSGHLIGSPRMIVKDMFIPCLSKQPNSFNAKATDFRPDNVLAPPIIMNHFFYVIDNFKKPSRKSLEECRYFNRKHVPEPRGFTVKVTSKTQKKRGCFSRMFCL